MCCLSGKSGGVQLVVGADAGVVYLRNGELRHAETQHARGLEAIYEMLRWGRAEFAYDANAGPAEQSIDIGWDAALIEVVMREREEQALRPGGSEPEISAAMLPPEPDLTGQEFGTYVVGPKLTESFWDKVYQAEQTSIGRPVVLHVLRSSLRETPERAQEFLDTASANANIRHPAILPVYEAGEYEGTYFYAREFVVGRTLYEIKARGHTIPETTALRVVRAIAEALAHLDAHGIMHAPLRLSRIFITPNDECRLADVAVASPAHGPALARPERNPDDRPHPHPDDEGDRHPGERARSHPHPPDADFGRKCDHDLGRPGAGGEKAREPSSGRRRSCSRPRKPACSTR